jgi:hypothetical protein
VRDRYLVRKNGRLNWLLRQNFSPFRWLPFAPSTSGLSHSSIGSGTHAKLDKLYIEPRTGARTVQRTRVRALRAAFPSRSPPRVPACSVNVNVRSCPNRGRGGGEFRRGWRGRVGLRGSDRGSCTRRRSIRAARRTYSVAPATRKHPGHAEGASPAVRHESGPFRRRQTRLGSAANDRLTCSANLRHAAGLNTSVGPFLSLVSRTSTPRLASLTSTQLAPPFEL